MLMIWFNKPHDIKTFTPAWAFLIFPMMLVGVVAFNALKVIPVTDPRCIGVLLVGYVFQGKYTLRRVISSLISLFQVLASS